MTILLALVPLFTSLPSAFQGQAPSDLDALFPPAKAPLTIAWAEGQERPTVMDLLKDYAELTGQNLSYNNETTQYLNNARIPLTSGVTVPAAEVQNFVESLLIATDFVLTLDRITEPRLIGVHSLQTSSRNTIRSQAIHLPIERLEWMRRHPAILCVTSIDLPNTDVRQVSNSMRTMITDANTQQMLPAGNSSTMVLTGFGRNIAALVDLLRTIDAASVSSERVEPALEVIRVRHAVAARLAPTVAAALSAARGLSGAVTSAPGAAPAPPAPASVLADDHSNSIIVVCWPTEVERARRLVAQLDVEVK